MNEQAHKQTTKRVNNNKQKLFCFINILRYFLATLSWSKIILDFKFYICTWYNIVNPLGKTWWTNSNNIVFTNMEEKTKKTKEIRTHIMIEYCMFQSICCLTFSMSADQHMEQFCPSDPSIARTRAKGVEWGGCKPLRLSPHSQILRSDSTDCCLGLRGPKPSSTFTPLTLGFHSPLNQMATRLSPAITNTTKWNYF